MNYSKDSRQKVKEAQSPSQSKKKKNKKKAKLSVLRLLFIIMIIGVFAVAGAGLGVFIGIIKSSPDISTLQLKPTTNYTSFIYDQNGKEIDRLSSGENRIYVELDNIPEHFQNAVIAIEDERFYEHKGIDIRGIFRAIVENVKTMDFTQGASTLTQQLIKNNILTSEKKLTRKIQEQYLAIQFEKVYSKEMILEYYLNTIHLGDGEYGVQAAANFYFNKEAKDLTLAESAVLASIPKATTKFNPRLNPEENWKRAQVILDKMEMLGMITADEKAAALEEDPYTNIATNYQQIQDTSTHSYFVDAVTEQVLKDLQEKNGMTLQQANNMIYGGGLQIYTTMDPGIQKIVDKHMSNDELFPQKVEYTINYAATIIKADGTELHRGGQGLLKSKDEESIKAFQDAKLADWGYNAETDKIANPITQLTPQTQAAFVIADQHNGHVKAMSGGRGEKHGDRVLNRATQAQRQPGSTFKVLAAYAPALDLGLLSPGSVIVDEKFEKGKYKPNNWYDGFEGPSTVRRGIYRSMNILAVKALDLVGVNSAYDYLINFGFTTLSEKNDKYLPLALGGISSGVTPMELNAAYATIANGGTYIKPVLYTKVLDMDGNVLLDNATPETRTVLKDSTASMLTNMMEDTFSASGSTGGTVARHYKSTAVAGKTGTTQDDKDFLLSAYTPYYTATVWMGYDQPSPFSIRSQASSSDQSHQLLWSKIMADVHAELPYESFKLNSTGYTQTTICVTSGKLPTDYCKQADHKLSTDYMQKQHIPTEYCDIQVEVKICTLSNKLATEFCPPETVETRTQSVTSEEVCDMHTAETIPPTDQAWPEWPDLPGWPNTGDNDGDNGNGNGNEVVEPSVPDDTIIPPPTPVPPTPTPPEVDDDFYIPQG